MNICLMEKFWCLLSNAQIDKSFWTEVLEYASHLINRLPATAIGSITPLDIGSGGVAQNYGLLWVFRYPTYFSIKDDKLNPLAKKFVFMGVKRNMKGYKLWDPKNKKSVLSKHATFDETSLLKSTISQQMERLKN